MNFQNLHFIRVWISAKLLALLKMQMQHVKINVSHCQQQTDYNVDTIVMEQIRLTLAKLLVTAM
jgi:hypothetical protein